MAKDLSHWRDDTDELLDDHLPEPKQTVRDRVLQEARKITAVDRNSSYGEPQDNFQNIADIWNAQGFWFRTVIDGNPAWRQLTGTDVALMMVGMKLARLKHNPTHRDSWVDTAGYAACGYEVSQRAEEQDFDDSHEARAGDRKLPVPDSHEARAGDRK